MLGRPDSILGQLHTPATARIPLLEALLAPTAPATPSPIVMALGRPPAPKPPAYHVVPRDGAWAVEQGGRIVSRGHRTQDEAGGSVVLLAMLSGSEVVYHRPDGRIRDSDSYGRDPRASRDTRH